MEEEEEREGMRLPGCRRLAEAEKKMTVGAGGLLRQTGGRGRMCEYNKREKGERQR